jgi:hypothetical protein
VTDPSGYIPSGTDIFSYTPETISSLKDMTQASAMSIMTTSTVSTYTNTGSMTTSFVKAAGDQGMADLCEAIAGIQVFGIKPFAFMQAWADQLHADAQEALATGAQAMTNTNTIANGVTANITGSVASNNPSDVGTSVGILNNTVQASSQPPQTVIVTSSQTVSLPTGTRTVVMNVFGAGGGGGRGNSVSGSGLAAGGGGVGGWQKDISLPAYSLTSTLTCHVGTKGLGGGTDNYSGSDGGTSYVADAAGTTIYVQATGGGGGHPMSSGSSNPDFGPLTGSPGSGNGVSQLPGTSGGHGGIYNLVVATAGAGGINVGGGGAAGAAGGGNGGTGATDTSSLTPGNGGSGGGGGPAGSSGNAGNGGNGGHPGGAGGGGGAFYSFGSNGNGGDGADGEIWLTFVF